MNDQDQTTFDPRIADWLEGDVNEAPAQTLQVVLAAFPSIRQQHRRAMPMGWRVSSRSTVAGMAVAAVLVVGLIAGALRLITPDRGIGGPSPSPAPSSPAPSAPAVAWSAFHSTRFAYSIEYPADWVVTPATEDWPVRGFPYPDSLSVDRFGPTRTSPTWVFASSVALAPGQVAAERIAELDGDNALACRLQPEQQIAVGGLTAREQDFFCFAKDYGIEVIAAAGGRFYQIDLISSTPIDGSMRATFERFLASVAFGGP